MRKIILFAVINLILFGCKTKPSDNTQRDFNLAVLFLNFFEAPGQVSSYSLSKSYSITDLTAYSENSSFTSITGKSISHSVNSYQLNYFTNAKFNASNKATALVFLPTGTVPSGGYKFIVWNHGTVGIADKCAPSANIGNSYSQPDMLQLLAGRGYIVVAPDYAGLGVSNHPHSYLVKKETAISIWDSVKAAKNLAGLNGLTTSNDVVIFGHSQGGGSTLFAYEYANTTYSHEFNLKGAIAGAPSPIWLIGFDAMLSYTTSNVPAKITTFLSMFLWSLAQYNTNLSMSDVIQSTVQTAISQNAESKCRDEISNENPFGNLTASQTITQPFLSIITQANSGTNTYSDRKAKYENQLNGWGSIFIENSPGNFSNKTIPLRIIQGTSDTTSLKTWTDFLYDTVLLNNPSIPISYKVVTGATHDTITTQYDQYLDYLLGLLQ